MFCHRLGGDDAPARGSGWRVATILCGWIVIALATAAAATWLRPEIAGLQIGLALSVVLFGVYQLLLSTENQRSAASERTPAGFARAMGSVLWATLAQPLLHLIAIGLISRIAVGLGVGLYAAVLAWAAYRLSVSWANRRDSFETTRTMFGSLRYLELLQLCRELLRQTLGRSRLRP